MRKSVRIKPIGFFRHQRANGLSGTGRLDGGDAMHLQQFTEQIACKLIVFDNQYTLHSCTGAGAFITSLRASRSASLKMSCSVIRFSNGVVESNIPPVQSAFPKLYAQCALAKLHFQVLQHNKRTCFL
jgi:hypothetical protein